MEKKRLVQDVIMPIFDLFSLDAQIKRIDLSFETCDKNDPFVMVDKDRVQQIRINLL